VLFGHGQTWGLVEHVSRIQEITTRYLLSAQGVAVDVEEIMQAKPNNFARNPSTD